MIDKNKAAIFGGETCLGIEFGSTRIKAVLTDFRHNVLASGSFFWKNKLQNGIWTYDLKDAISGMQSCYADLLNDVNKRYGIGINNIGAIGVSGMMHGYIALDKDGCLLTPFRTWRNTITGEAAEKLSDLFKFNIPERWSIAHLYQAILNGEEHVKDIAVLDTLAVYIHYLLTGRRVAGIGEASGMFPIDSVKKCYNKEMLAQFDSITKDKNFSWNLIDILPKILPVGSNAGYLTDEGAMLLDKSGALKSGIPFCPPEGDAGTGMTATNAVLPRTGNVSAGTSVFAMVVLEKELEGYYPEIDMVTTPSGNPVAMVHCNNCTGDIDCWAAIIKEAAEKLGAKSNISEIYDCLYNASDDGDPDCGGLVNVNYLSGESITGFDSGKPLFIRNSDANFNLSNFMRSELYSAVSTLRIGMDILFEKEGVKIDSIAGHGGFFKNEGAGARVMSAAFKTPVTIMKTAGEGGPWGMSVLASYMLNKKAEQTLSDYLASDVFKSTEVKIYSADKKNIDGFDRYLAVFKSALIAERVAVNKNIITDDSLQILKNRVYKANLELVKHGLVVLTWGNVSAIDRNKGLIVIKPSGVSYDKMTVDDMVVIDLNGKVVDGKLKPSSDTPTHIALYKAFPNIGGIVHTHSINATSFAQAGKSITAFGTTHADCFYGDIPLTRALTKEELADNYELNTGKVIEECFEDIDYQAVPAVLVKNHGPFTWGITPEKAVEAAVTLEAVAEMAINTLLIDKKTTRVKQQLLDKHYYRKHGKNAYYGQK